MKNYELLEIELLKMWKESLQIEKVFKYKHRIMICEDYSNDKIFNDLTNGLIFKDIVDLAEVDINDASPEKYSVSIDLLLKSRGV